jgi:hypothetical protein
MLRARAVSVLLVAGCTSAGPIAAAERSAWIEASYMSFATAKATPQGGAGGRHLIEKPFSKPPDRLDLGLPSSLQIAALAIDTGDVYFVTATTWQSEAGLVTPRDVMRLQSGGSATISIAGDLIGLPATTSIDALSIRGGETLLSLSTHAEINGTSVRRSDVLSWNGAALSVHVSAATMGIPSHMNLTALDRTATGTLLVSFDVGGEVAGIASMPGDILEYIPTTSTWRESRSRDGRGFTCMPCDLQALAADTSATTIFRSGAESFEEY